jgi:hypothetical protein
MPACHDRQTLDDFALPPLHGALPSENSAITPSADHESPRVPRFLAAASRDHVRDGTSDVEYWDVTAGNEAVASPESASWPEISSDAVTSLSSPVGETEMVAAELTQEEAIEESWPCPSDSFPDEPTSALARLVARAPGAVLLGTLLLGIGMGGGGVGVAMSDRSGSWTTKLTDVVSGSDPARPTSASPAEPPPIDAAGLDGPSDATAAVIDLPSTPAVGARSNTRAAVVGRIHPPRPSSGARRLAAVATSPPPSPSESTLGGAMPHPPPPMGGPTLEPRSDMTVAAETSMPDEKLPESHELESLLQPTVTTSPPPVELAELLREAETETRRLAQRIAASSTDRNYKIQLGLFIEPHNARQYWSQLPEDVLRIADSSGYNLEETTINGVKYQRLYVGRFSNLGDSIASCDAIKNIGIDCYVVY